LSDVSRDLFSSFAYLLGPVSRRRDPRSPNHCYEVAVAPGRQQLSYLDPLPPFAIKLGTKEAKAKIKLKAIKVSLNVISPVEKPKGPKIQANTKLLDPYCLGSPN